MEPVSLWTGLEPGSAVVIQVPGSRVKSDSHLTFFPGRIQAEGLSVGAALHRLGAGVMQGK